MSETMYRYTNGSGGVIILEHHRVISLTPMGKWVEAYGVKKFVRNDTRKRFAHETKAAALEAFIARKNRQACILGAQLKNVNDCLKRAEGATPETLKVHPDYFDFL